ncbi:hypothetical protein [Helicobacter sp. T3_23-1059]
MNLDCHDSSPFDKSLESRNDSNTFRLKIAQTLAMRTANDNSICIAHALSPKCPCKSQSKLQSKCQQ